MDRCPNCGATVRSGAKFCTTCGMRLPEPAAPQSTDSTPRSPFDSTSTVASRWPSRSIYGTAELTPPEGEDQPGNGDSTGDSATDGTAMADASVPTESEATLSPSDTTSTSTSTWGGWTSPTDTQSEPPAETTAANSWGQDAATASDDQTESETDGPEMKTGETDFLSLPEQPDPSAWATIESELKGESTSASEGEAPTASDDSPALEVLAVEGAAMSVDPTETGSSVEAATEAVPEAADDSIAADTYASDEEPESPAATAASPSVERANELLDELRGVIAGLSVSSAPAQASSYSFENVKPSADEIAQFASLRAAVDAASERPRDIDTMLDLSGRLDVIKALHDSFTRLNDAVTAAGSTGDQGDQPEE